MRSLGIKSGEISLQFTILSLVATAAELQQQTKNAVYAFPDYSRLETSVMTLKYNLSHAEKALKIQFGYYGAKVQNFRQKMKKIQAEFSQACTVSVPINDLEGSLPSSQKKIETWKKASAASCKLKNGADALRDAKKTVADLQTKLIGSEKKSE